jgi:4'-phosphopantetheinyl transferase
LRDTPRIQFNLSHSGGISLVAVALDVEVGVDVERLRPMPDCLPVAERFLPPGNAAALAEIPAVEREREFFVRWTRAEAMLKARGVGLYGAGTALDGEWTVAAIDAGEEHAAVVAAERSGMRVVMQQA